MKKYSILHLAHDAHLIESSFNVFERFYKDCNLFLVIPPRKGTNIKIKKESSNNFKWIDYSKKDSYNNILEICRKRNINKIVLHGATRYNVALAKFLKGYITCEVYWLFWGYELYSALSEDLSVSYSDEKFNLLKKRTYYYPNKIKHYLRFLRYRFNRIDILQEANTVVDYFCFWTDIDYKIFVKYFGDKIKYKRFGYDYRYKAESLAEEEVYDFPQKEQSIIVNHQASATGNHITVLDKIKKVDANGVFKIILPLSYGTKYFQKYFCDYAYKLFGDKFIAIKDYLPREEYFKIIQGAQVAIFGQKRQEATGNIGRLLILGTKVFLREDNPLLEYYRNLGYKIFSFEKDLNSIEDLKPLSEEDMVHNRKTWYKTRSYYEDFMPTLFD